MCTCVPFCCIPYWACKKPVRIFSILRTFCVLFQRNPFKHKPSLQKTGTHFLCTQLCTTHMHIKKQQRKLIIFTAALFLLYYFLTIPL